MHDQKSLMANLMIFGEFYCYTLRIFMKELSIVYYDTSTEIK